MLGGRPAVLNGRARRRDWRDFVNLTAVVALN